MDRSGLLSVVEKALIQYFKPKLNQKLIQVREPRIAFVPSKNPEENYIYGQTKSYKQARQTGRFSHSDNAVMATKPITVRLPADADAVIRKMSSKTEFLRNAIIEALKSSEQKSALKCVPKSNLLHI